MSGILVNIQILTVFFMVVLLVIAVSNVKNLPRLATYSDSAQHPFVSVLVPARDEELNIDPCVRSLLSQDYPNFEVIVLDDDSSDGTWEKLTSLAEGNGKLKILKGKPLPDAWTGKNWACHQLAKASKGELLLFTDADTRHHPDTLKKAVAAIQQEKADFLTALPREEAKTLAEKLTIPMISCGIFSLFPVAIAHKSAKPVLSLTIGQFMLFRRHAYDKIGGYEAVRQEVLDDMVLGRMIKESGFRWRLVDASDYVSCRMYHNLKGVFDGFTKNIFLLFKNNTLSYLPIWLWIGALFLLPIILLLLVMADVSVPRSSVQLALLSTALSLLLWGISISRFRYPLYITLFYPIIILLWSMIGVRSMIMTLTGNLTWKGRRIDTNNELWDKSSNLNKAQEP